MTFLLASWQCFFVVFVLLFFALVAKAIDSLEERLKDEREDNDGEDDDVMSYLIYEPWMYDDDFWK